ncbi:PRC-barrel domain-containing protein [Dactylosporangium sp. CS-033363]|uniref:PRC-barrel domain-containing protein n=1 Tax=Dactylosporangium sp. CS-033363 TaxID=3239935 RepID=UPI003D907504
MLDGASGEMAEPARLRGMPVRAFGGERLGNVVAIHIEADTERIVLLQVGAADDEHQWIIPADGARMDGGQITVRFAADMVTRGPTASAGTPLSIGELAYVLERYGAGVVEPGARPVTERIEDVGDVAALHPDVRRLPPIVIIRPALTGDEPSPDDPGPARA